MTSSRLLMSITVKFVFQADQIYNSVIFDNGWYQIWLRSRQSSFEAWKHVTYLWSIEFRKRLEFATTFGCHQNPTGQKKRFRLNMRGTMWTRWLADDWHLYDIDTRPIDVSIQNVSQRFLSTPRFYFIKYFPLVLMYIHQNYAECLVHIRKGPPKWIVKKRGINTSQNWLCIRSAVSQAMAVAQSQTMNLFAAVVPFDITRLAAGCWEKCERQK